MIVESAIFYVDGRRDASCSLDEVHETCREGRLALTTRETPGTAYASLRTVLYKGGGLISEHADRVLITVRAARKVSLVEDD